MIIKRRLVGVLLLIAAGCTDGSKEESRTDTVATSASVPVKDSLPKTDADIAAARTPAVVAFESFDFAKQKVDSASVYALSLDEARLLRGMVFGRHGRHFADDRLIQKYLDGQSWYRPDSAFTNDRLNDVERENLDVIRGAEASRHATIQPGDLRYQRGKVITTTMLGRHTPQQWKLIESEIWAINGHAFNDIPDPEDEFAADSSESLQLYYNDRYWYRAGRALQHADLSPEDRAILDTITVARIKDLGSWVTVGMMRMFQATALSEKNIEGNGIADLRMMRNEIYALRGREFTTPWIRRRLALYGYKPNGTFRESDLTEIERQNIALIRKVEERKHGELSTTELIGQNFVNTPVAFVRLLRNEIFARHGRVFKDKALQAYFSSMPWYKPNAAFDDSMLTAIEKANVATLLAHEKLMASGGRYPEG
jgi:hypothetical protein